MSFWYEAMSEFKKAVKPNADPYQSHVYGFISERIFNLYLYQLRMERPTLRIAEIPYVVADDIKRPTALSTIFATPRSLL
jgi:hypothetical protein